MAAALLAISANGAAARPVAQSGALPTLVAGLLDHFPAQAGVVTFANIGQARQVLGLPADAAIFPGKPPTAPLNLFYDDAALAIPRLGFPVRPQILRVLVQGDISGAATSIGSVGSATVIATSQSRGSILTKLKADGFRPRAGGAWLAPRSFPVGEPDYLAAYDGGVVEATRSRVAAALAAQTAMPASDKPIAAALLAGSAPSVAVVPVDQACVSSITITDRLAPHSGQLRIVTRGAPDPSRLRMGHLVASEKSTALIGHGRTSGDSVVAPLTAPRLAAHALPEPFPSALEGLPPKQTVYRCG